MQIGPVADRCLLGGGKEPQGNPRALVLTPAYVPPRDFDLWLAFASMMSAMVRVMPLCEQGRGASRAQTGSGRLRYPHLPCPHLPYPPCPHAPHTGNAPVPQT